MSFTWCGIGARKPLDEDVPKLHYLIDRIVPWINETWPGTVMTSGAAEGCDERFEKAAVTAGIEILIFLPWEKFRRHSSPYWMYGKHVHMAEGISADAHPAWRKLEPKFKLLMIRNAYQILGKDLKSPVKFVLCYTADGCQSHEKRTRGTGGTGQAITIADFNDIPVINLKRHFGNLDSLKTAIKAVVSKASN